jgi:hypothetical protein
VTQEALQRLALHVVRRAAEEELGRVVQALHLALAVECQDGVERGVEDGLHAPGVAARDLHLAACEAASVLAAGEPERGDGEHGHRRVEREQADQRAAHGLHHRRAIHLPHQPPPELREEARHDPEAAAIGGGHLGIRFDALSRHRRPARPWRRPGDAPTRIDAEVGRGRGQMDDLPALDAHEERPCGGAEARPAREHGENEILERGLDDDGRVGLAFGGPHGDDRGDERDLAAFTAGRAERALAARNGALEHRGVGERQLEPGALARDECAAIGREDVDGVELEGLLRALELGAQCGAARRIEPVARGRGCGPCEAGLLGDVAGVALEPPHRIADLLALVLRGRGELLPALAHEVIARRGVDPDIEERDRDDREHAEPDRDAPGIAAGVHPACKQEPGRVAAALGTGLRGSRRIRPRP